MTEPLKRPERFCGMKLTAEAHPRHAWGPDGGAYICPGERRVRTAKMGSTQGEKK